MANEVISDRPARLRDYRCAGEVLSLALTFIILLSLYALAAIFFPETWSSTLKALLITLAGLIVYIISVKLQQRAAIGTMVRVGRRQFPELYDLAAKAAERLSHPQVLIYVKRQSEMNIYTIGLWQQPIIVLTSSLVDQMEPDNLQFFIGREIGHVTAGHIWLRTLLKPLGADVPIFGKLLNSVVFGDWINRTEFTADRAGFIACRSLTTTISTMLKFGVGVRLFEKLDIKEFLDQINEVSDVRGHLTEIVAEQPYLTRRIRSLVKFSLSERYKSLAPEKQSDTQILKAIPKKFVTSRIGGPDLEDDAPGRLESGREELRATAEDESKIDDEITATDLAPIEDQNSPDPRLSLIGAGGFPAYTLRRSLTRIGRNSENDVVINSERVSRHHAEIARQGDVFLIVDKGSRNGVWVNRRRVESSAAIKSGDVIRIGRQEFTFIVREDQI
ncbi:MAG TPA: FHA domain-containing protein [Blastocatellia bacterium]|jgi:Zn-dependent protease with chaperone function|nr:FHA domain-containing protein [Blastocatellia bacterium]